MEISVAMFIPRFPIEAKKTRRLIGLLKSLHNRYVAMMKAIPMSEGTVATLSTIASVSICDVDKEAIVRYG